MSDLCPVAVAGGNAPEEIQPKMALESYLEALKQTKLCDVVFTFENSQDRIEAHQLFLRLRSPVFFDMFRGQGANVGKMREVQINGVAPQRFQELLEFMYADRFEVNIAGALDLLHLGHKYKVHPLIKKCEEMLKTDIKVKDAVQLFETARKYQNAELEQKAGDIMATNLEEICRNDGLLHVQEDTLVYLLERDDLTVDEVDLFRLVFKWGKGKLSVNSDPDELKSMLTNVLPRIRFTNMTPNEFTSEVVPSNLLPAHEMVTIYSYFGNNEVNRRNMSALLKFSITPRKSKETNSLIRFYKNDTTTAVRDVGAKPLKECLSFSPVYGVHTAGLKQWNNYPTRGPAIVGIIIHFPIDPGRNLQRAEAGFELSIRCSDRTISDKSVVERFKKQLTNCEPGQETEIKVEPPVDLNNGDNYCIAVEDIDANTYYRRCTVHGTCYMYEQSAAGCSIRNENLSVGLKKFPMKLKTIQRNTSLNGFVTTCYPKMNVIQGVRISLI